MQLEFDFVWSPQVVKIGYVAHLLDTNIDGFPIVTEELLDDYFEV